MIILIDNHPIDIISFDGQYGHVNEPITIGSFTYPGKQRPSGSLNIVINDVNSINYIRDWMEESLNCFNTPNMNNISYKRSIVLNFNGMNVSVFGCFPSRYEENFGGAICVEIIFDWSDSYGEFYSNIETEIKIMEEYKVEIKNEEITDEYRRCIDLT